MTVPRTASRLALPMVFVAVAWYVGLATLAIRTANPVTINARQVLNSDLVVIGTISEDGTVQVSQSFLAVLPKEPLTLARDGTLPTGELILPLVRDGRLFRVTQTGLPGAADRLVYPANADTIAQLEKVLQP